MQKVKRRKDREKWIAQKREWIRRHRAGRLKFALDYLGGLCTICGTNQGLEFDHMPGKGSKIRNVTIMLTYSMEKLKAELDKCQLLCAECHEEITQHRRTSNLTDEEAPF